jgi:hypothetical protein
MAALATFVKLPGSSDRCGWFYSYLTAPTSGTFQINFPGGIGGDYIVLTLKDAAQSNPDDASAVNSAIASSVTVSTTTTTGSDLLLSMGARVTDAFNTYGSGQIEIANTSSPIGYVAATVKSANTTPGTESASGGEGSTVDTDWGILAIKPAAPATVASTPTILDTLPLSVRFRTS